MGGQDRRRLMAEGNLPAFIVDKDFQDRLSSVLRLRGRLGDYLGFTPQVQPTFDITRYLSGFEASAFEPGLIGPLLPDLEVLGPTDGGIAARNSTTVSDTYIARIGPNNSSPRLTVGSSYTFLGTTTVIQKHAGVAFHWSAALDKFPGGVYALKAFINPETVPVNFDVRFGAQASENAGIVTLTDIVSLGGKSQGIDRSTPMSGNIFQPVEYRAVVSMQASRFDTVCLRSSQQLGGTDTASATVRIQMLRILSQPLLLPVTADAGGPPGD